MAAKKRTTREVILVPLIVGAILTVISSGYVSSVNSNLSSAIGTCNSESKKIVNALEQTKCQAQALKNFRSDQAKLVFLPGIVGIMLATASIALVLDKKIKARR